MTSPIIIFDPSGLTENQVKQVRVALEHAYEAGYETARKQYQLKFNTEPTKNPQPQTWITGGTLYNNCSHDGSFSGGKTYADTKGTFADTRGTFADTSNSITNIANGYAVTNDITGLSQAMSQKYCDHRYVDNKNRALGICGLCGLSFDKWHG